MVIRCHKHVKLVGGKKDRLVSALLSLLRSPWGNKREDFKKSGQVREGAAVLRRLKTHSSECRKLTHLKDGVCGEPKVLLSHS